MAFKLNRRTFLRGTGGLAIALPVLECMLDGKPAQAAEAPKRYLVCFGGQSLGSDCDTVHNYYVPDTVGPNYDLKTALQPLGAGSWNDPMRGMQAGYDVQQYVSVVSGLGIPTANGGATPAGGRSDDFHITSLSPLFSGVRSGAETVNGATSDQIVAAAIAGPTIHPSLVYRVQAAWYLSVSAPYGRDLMSYKDAQSPIAATVSPQAAFDSLFYNFAPPDDPAAAALQDFNWRKRKSILDLVRGNAERLVDKLGGEDKKRIEKHLDEIRALEKQVAAIPPVAMGSCAVPGAPTDPPLGGDQGVDGNGDNTYDTSLGYSGEEERARAFCDLVHMAFTCDLSRVGSLMFTMAQSHMSMFQLTGQATDLHEVGHCGVPGGTMAVSEAIRWHMKHFGYLLAKFRDTIEMDGSRLIDNSAIVFLHEGGHGYDPGGAKDDSAHSTENMACLIAGRAGGLNTGEHVVANGMHPANVLITAMNAAGVATNTLGEVSGQIPGLLT